MTINLTTHLSARLQHLAVGGTLLSHYADQVRATGTATTAEDALGAWRKWCEAQGGKMASPPEVADWKDDHHERVAAVLREVARYDGLNK